MAAEAALSSNVSYADYLAMERVSDVRHEWYNGRTYAMAGGTIAHGELASSMQRELGTLALACGCRVFSSDVKIRVLATGLATYPDASMICGPLRRDPADPDAITNPTLIVEVLSDSTEGYDRGEKARHYRQIPSLRDYVLVSQHEPRIEVYSREGDHWALRAVEAGEAIALTALVGALVVDRVYQGVELTQATRSDSSG